MTSGLKAWEKIEMELEMEKLEKVMDQAMGHSKESIYPPDSLINLSCEVDTELHELSRFADEGNPNTPEC